MLPELTRCPSQPIRPPNDLQRRVTGAGSAASTTAEPFLHSRLPFIEGSRSVSEANPSWCELPPLVPSRCGSRAAHATRRGGDLEGGLYDAFGLESKAPAQLVSNRTTPPRPVPSEEARSAAAVVVAQQEMESLRRQVGRLTQLKHDRDRYIQDMMAEVEEMKRRHENEVARKTACNLKEMSECLDNKEREHQKQVEEWRGKLRQSALHTFEVRKECWKRLMLQSWASAAKEARAAASAARSLKQSQHKAALQEGALRHRLHNLLLAQVEDSRIVVQHLALHGWAWVAVGKERARRVAGHALSREDAQHVRQLLGVVLHSWRLVIVVTEETHHMETPSCQANVDANAHDLAQVTGHTQAGHVHFESSGLRKRSVQLRARHALQCALYWWAVVVRDARREARHRQELLLAAAEASAKLFKACADSKRASQELRRQRRAHGVAAIHASLDRRVQAVVHAWASLSRDAQREALYQRQLDIAAAESAAGCAVLRMEGRRNSLELRQQRRTQACRRIVAQERHWCHVTLYAWSARCLVRQQEELLVQNLSVAASQMDAAQAQVEVAWTEVDRYREAAGRWQQSCMILRERLAVRGCTGCVFISWRLVTTVQRGHAAPAVAPWQQGLGSCAVLVVFTAWKVAATLLARPLEEAFVPTVASSVSMVDQSTAAAEATVAAVLGRALLPFGEETVD